MGIEHHQQSQPLQKARSLPIMTEEIVNLFLGFDVMSLKLRKTSRVLHVVCSGKTPNLKYDDISYFVYRTQGQSIGNVLPFHHFVLDLGNAEKVQEVETSKRMSP